MSLQTNPESVRKTANLARLYAHASDDFVEKFQEELNSLLIYVDQLQEVKLTRVENSRVQNISNLRTDVPLEEGEAIVRKKENIIRNFPRSQGNLLILPGIFE